METAPAIDSVAAYMLALETIDLATGEGDGYAAMAEDLYLESQPR